MCVFVPVTGRSRCSPTQDAHHGWVRCGAGASGLPGEFAAAMWTWTAPQGDQGKQGRCSLFAEER